VDLYNSSILLWGKCVIWKMAGNPGCGEDIFPDLIENNKEITNKSLSSRTANRIVPVLFANVF